MSPDQAIDLMRQMLWRAFVVSSPVLFGALAVGLLVSLLQVATQLQEMTLSYVPKLIVTALILSMFGGWMLVQITQFAIYSIRLIPSLR